MAAPKRIGSEPNTRFNRKIGETLQCRVLSLFVNPRFACRPRLSGEIRSAPDSALTRPNKGTGSVAIAP